MFFVQFNYLFVGSCVVYHYTTRATHDCVKMCRLLSTPLSIFVLYIMNIDKFQNNNAYKEVSGETVIHDA